MLVATSTSKSPRTSASGKSKISTPKSPVKAKTNALEDPIPRHKDEEEPRGVTPSKSSAPLQDVSLEEPQTNPSI